MPVTTTQYAIQKVFTIRGYNIATGKLELELKKLKETTFTNGQETVFVTGGQANAQLASFDHSKTAKISGSSAAIDEGLLSAQLGTEVEVLSDTKDIEFLEVLDITSASAVPTHEPTGGLGSEFEYAYILDAGGSVVETLKQGATAAKGVFAYTSETNSLKFNAGDYPDGTRVKVKYYPNAASAKKISNPTTSFSKTVKLVADALLKDICTDQIVRGQIVADKGKISGAFEWTLSANGEPAVHNFEATFMESCGADKLWDFYIFEETDFS